MSSFIGHSVAAISVLIATESIVIRQHPRQNFNSWRSPKIICYGWLLWIVVVASIPDLDYIVKPLHPSNHDGLRITHSILFCLLAPSFTIVVLWFKQVRGIELKLLALQVTLTSFSHTVLDFLVGVTPLPILFPIINSPVKLPFGILPSAGKIDLNNYYFYRNLQLEMGVLIPVLLLIFCWSSYLRKSKFKLNLYALNICKIGISIPLLVCCIYFIKLNLQLPR